jgi:hypothetical protein
VDFRSFRRKNIETAMVPAAPAAEAGRHLSGHGPSKVTECRLAGFQPGMDSRSSGAPDQKSRNREGRKGPED